MKMNIKQKIGTAIAGLGLALTIGGIVAPAIDNYRNNITCTSVSQTRCGTKFDPELREQVADCSFLGSTTEYDTTCYQTVPVEPTYITYQDENVLEQLILKAKPRVDTITEEVLRPGEFIDDEGKHYIKKQLLSSYTPVYPYAVGAGILGVGLICAGGMLALGKKKGE